MGRRIQPGRISRSEMVLSTANLAITTKRSRVRAEQFQLRLRKRFMLFIKNAVAALYIQYLRPSTKWAMPYFTVGEQKNMIKRCLQMQYARQFRNIFFLMISLY